ncbi:MAG: dienelactone hydrolase family protein [Ginsengibacter sp.]
MKKIYFNLIILLTIFISQVSFSQMQARQEAKENIDTLPSLPFLPNPLLTNEGRNNIPVTSNNQWQEKRQWIGEQYQHWICGTFPPAPDKVSAQIISEKKEGSTLLRMVQLSFGPDNKGKMTVELIIPLSDKPLPVFMTQWNHRGWAQIAVRRGYIGCVYAGADVKDDTKNYEKLYPEYSFSTLMKRAWGASRVVDYLYTLPEVDTARIGITGHSRNGKQSLLAAAFDARIKAVVSSSAGTGGENPFRYTDDEFNNESIDSITTNFPDWFHPRLRLFIGKEDKLPVDQNSLMALVAPRGLMLSTALNETEGGAWGIEQAFFSAKKVYQFTKAEDKLAVSFRSGRHPVAARDIENFIDFFDYVFGRSHTPPENKLYYNYTFENWQSISKEKTDPLQFTQHSSLATKIKNDGLSQLKQNTAENIKWLLGDEPPGVQSNNEGKIGELVPDDYLADVIPIAKINQNIKKIVIGPYDAAGDYLWAYLYLPEKTNLNIGSTKAKLPLVIFLHEYANGTGYRRNEEFFEQLTKKGFAVLTFDMIGYGTRIEEFKNFYSRYPHWSIMGKMVADTRNIISDAITRMPFIDSSNIFITGYALGGTVAMFTAALDHRIKGLAVASAFSSFRTTDKTTEGIRHYSHLHGLIPRLGFFVGNEDRIPVDFEEIIATIAPTNLMIIAPKQDRHHPPDQIKSIVNFNIDLNKELKASHSLILKQPDTYDHFSKNMREDICNWILQITKSTIKNK